MKIEKKHEYRITLNANEASLLSYILDDVLEREIRNETDYDSVTIDAILELNEELR